MAKLNVEIVTPERQLGLFGVRPGHTALLSVLQPGPLTVREGTSSTVYFVSGGFVEAGPAVVRVLADSAEPRTEIDTAAATKRIAAAEASLKELEVTDPRAEAQRDIIRREKKRLEVAGGR